MLDTIKNHIIQGQYQKAIEILDTDPNTTPDERNEVAKNWLLNSIKNLKNFTSDNCAILELHTNELDTQQLKIRWERFNNRYRDLLKEVDDARKSIR